MRTIFDPAKVNFAPYPPGALDGHLRAFAGLLAAGRYTTAHGLAKLRQFSDFSHWLKRNHIELKGLDERVVGRFLATRRKHSRDFGMAATLTLLMNHLRGVGVVAPKGSDLPESGVDRIVHEYRDHQIEDRCLGEPTVTGYVAVIRRFLNTVFPHGTFDPGELTPEKISGFVVGETTRLGRKACQLATCALRNFLRFLLMKGLLEKDLTAAVPTVAGWQASRLPHYLDPSEVEALLASCDRSTDAGKRNRAILLLLARLGLRAGEVSRLNLDDVDWRAGEIRVRGKNERTDRMPLPQDVGEAIVTYLQCRPPGSSSPRLFLHVHAPYGDLVASPPNSVSSIVRRALKRADLHPPHRGAHILRHSLATRMLGSGVSMFQIGQVLRHTDIQSTEVYAKVDLASLKKLAQPWPGGES